MSTVCIKMYLIGLWHVYVFQKAIINFNLYLMNGFSHHYHLGESTFILRDIRVILKFIPFFDEFSLMHKQTEKPQMGHRVLRHHIWGYFVCLCPIKGMPGLKELTVHYEDKI